MEKDMKELTEALESLNRLIEIVQEKGVLHEGVDDGLVKEFEDAQIRSSALQKQFLEKYRK